MRGALRIQYFFHDIQNELHIRNVAESVVMNSCHYLSFSASLVSRGRRTTWGECGKNGCSLPHGRASRQVARVVLQAGKKRGRKGDSTLARVVNHPQRSEYYFYALHSDKGKQNARIFARLKMPDPYIAQIQKEFELMSSSQFNRLLEALEIDRKLFRPSVSPSDLWYEFKDQVVGKRIPWEVVEREIAKVFGREMSLNVTFASTGTAARSSDTDTKPSVGGVRVIQTHKIIEEIRNCGNFLQRIDANVNELLRNGQRT